MFSAIHRLFNNAALRKLFLYARLPIMLALLVVVARYAEARWLPEAFLVSAFGEAIQLWSFASLVKNEELTARGPYVIVRNPMYLGRYFLILGFLMLLANVYVLIAYTVFYYFYMVNRVAREETRLARLLGEPYAKYSRRVNRFLPMLNKLGDPALRYFRFRVLAANNGHWNLLSMLAAWAVIAVYLLWIRG